MEPYNTIKRRKRVKLIFNPSSGENDESPIQLMDVIKEMQALKLIPETFLIEANCDLLGVVKDAIEQGIHMFVVCGGDGTISAVIRAMFDTNATLGIIPTGTQNNVAHSLGIPTDIPSAIAILRKGKRLKTDIGIVTCGDISTPFVEVCSVGLFSTLFPSGDDIQHGNLSRIGDFIKTLTTTPPSEIKLLLDNKQEIKKLGHVVLICNMPFVCRHYQVGSINSFNDGFLDVLLIDDLSKLDLLSYILMGPATSPLEDSNIKSFRARSIEIDTHPAMPIMADGIMLGEGLVRIEIRRKALAVMTGTTFSNNPSESGEIQ